MKHLVTLLLFLSFILLAVVGPSMVGHEQGSGCPFAHGSSSMCDLPLLHLAHWQSALSGLIEHTLIVLLTITFVIVGWLFNLFTRDPRRDRPKLSPYTYARPTLFQELFSQGILHPKEP